MPAIYVLAHRALQKAHHLLGLEWPVQLRACIDAAKHRDSQTVILNPIGTLSDIDQLDQQPIFDQRHEHFLSQLA
jgi:hypothetical protein